MLSSRWTPYLFVLPVLVGIGVFRLTPIAVAIFGSLTGVSLMGETRFVGFDNFVDLLTDPDFWSSVHVTLLFNIIINPLQLVVAFCLALLVFRPLRGLWLYRTLLVLPMAVSTGLSAVLFGLFLDANLGPLNSFLQWIGVGIQPFHLSQGQALYTLIGIATWKGAGYWMLFLLAGLYAIPATVYEAALIDGSSAWQRLRHVTLPLMRRPMMFVLVVDTTFNFLFFAPVYILTSGGPAGSTSVLMFQAYQAAFTFSDIGRSLAISVILLALILLIVTLEFRLMRPPGERR